MQPLMSLLPLILSRNRTPGNWMDAFIEINSLVFAEEPFSWTTIPCLRGKSDLCACFDQFCCCHVEVEKEVRHQRTFLQEYPQMPLLGS